MILVDTVIWADHFGKSDSRLVSLLDQRQVCTHPHVIGELALGNLRQHSLIIGFLQRLPQIVIETELGLLSLIRTQQLSGSGIGYTDAHLIASVLRTADALLWTRDRRLNDVAHRFGRSWLSA